jgi:hypothetical protein
MGASLANDVVVVMVLFFGHVGGEEQCSGRPWWWRRFGNDISQIMCQRSRSEIAGRRKACVKVFSRESSAF